MKRTALVMCAASLLGMVACGGSSSKPSSSSGSGTSLARLLVISTDVTVAAGSAAPVSAATGRELSVGDTVRTDAAGFAQLRFFDGSLTRVDHAARFVLTRLVDREGARAVDTELVSGRSWNRIQKLSESESWQQSTPVASATVRGTAYAADCSIAAKSCTFTVVDGVVVLTLPDGSHVTLSAQQRVTLSSGKPAPAVQKVTVADLLADKWITTNLALDRQGGTNPTTSTTRVSGISSIDPCTLLTTDEVIGLGNAMASSETNTKVGKVHAPVATTDAIGRRNCSFPFDYAPPHDPTCGGGPLPPGFPGCTGGEVNVLVGEAPSGLGTCEMTSAPTSLGTGPWDFAGTGRTYAVVTKNGACVNFVVGGVGGTALSTFARPFLVAIANRLP